MAKGDVEVRPRVGETEKMTINLGVVDLGQIDLAIEDGSFYANTGLGGFVEKLKASGGTAHLMGVISDGGVHGHIQHVLAAARAADYRDIAIRR